MVEKGSYDNKTKPKILDGDLCIANFRGSVLPCRGRGPNGLIETKVKAAVAALNLMAKAAFNTFPQGADVNFLVHWTPPTPVVQTFGLFLCTPLKVPTLFLSVYDAMLLDVPLPRPFTATICRVLKNLRSPINSTFSHTKKKAPQKRAVTDESRAYKRQPIPTTKKDPPLRVTSIHSIPPQSYNSKSNSSKNMPLLAKPDLLSL